MLLRYFFCYMSKFLLINIAYSGAFIGVNGIHTTSDYVVTVITLLTK